MGGSFSFWCLSQSLKLLWLVPEAGFTQQLVSVWGWVCPWVHEGVVSKGSNPIRSLKVGGEGERSKVTNLLSPHPNVKKGVISIR